MTELSGEETLRSSPAGAKPMGAPVASEPALVARLHARARAARVQADPLTLAHCYIALKSKPMAVLVGPAGRGKVTLIETISQVFFGNDPIGFQKMDGHAWWASGSGNVAFFTQAQTRFNTTKLLALIHEALRLKNRNRVYLACMTHISPAELQDYFAALAFQLQHGELIRLPTAHLSAPIPFPPNLRLVGTLDVERFAWFDRGLLAHTSLIFWPAEAEAVENAHPTPPSPFSASMSPTTWVRGSAAARFKLSQHFRWPSQAIQPLSDLLAALKKEGIVFPENILGEASIYLANCWAEDGPGLYALAPERNLEIALDMAAMQTVLPHCLRAIAQGFAPAASVGELLGERFPRTQALLSQWA